jgi:hypothetical protein
MTKKGNATTPPRMKNPFIHGRFINTLLQLGVGPERTRSELF